MIIPLSDRAVPFIPGFSVCFWPRGKRVAASPVPQKTPEEILLRKEQITLVLIAAMQEANHIYTAICLILLARYNMAEACHEAGIRHQSELLRAIQRIARNVQTMME